MNVAAIVEFFTNIEDTVLELGASPWVLLAVMLLATIDGVFPPVPSESIVIAVAVLAVAGEAPSLWLVWPAAALGAFTGDQVAYTIGKHVPVDRLAKRPRGHKFLRGASRLLDSRGTMLILSARFVPVGRVAVNMSAGAVGFPRVRFVVIAAIAAVVWSAYSIGIGLVTGHAMDEQPLLGVLIGVLGGVALGYVVDFILRRVRARFGVVLPGPAGAAEEAGSTDDAEPGGR